MKRVKHKTAKHYCNCSHVTLRLIEACGEVRKMFIKSIHESERKAVMEWVSLRYINRAAVLKTIRIYVIIYTFSLHG